MIISLLVVAAAFAVARFRSAGARASLGCSIRSTVAAIFGLHEKEVGHLPFEIPDFAGFYWRPQDVYGVLPAALGLAFVSSVNILITSRVVEHFRGKHKHLKRSDADGELGAYGIANIVAGMFAAPMSVGIPARSLASVRCGGSTRLSNIFHGLFIVAFLGLGGEYISRIPMAALAGVTAYIGICLLEWSTWRRLRRMRRVDAAAFLTTAVAVLVVNAVLAVALGCSFYLLRYVYRRFVSPVPVQHLESYRTSMAEMAHAESSARQLNDQSCAAASLTSIHPGHLEHFQVTVTAGKGQSACRFQMFPVCARSLRSRERIQVSLCADVAWRSRNGTLLKRRVTCGSPCNRRRATTPTHGSCCSFGRAANQSCQSSLGCRGAITGNPRWTSPGL